jgi:hypothetical protein
VNSITCYNSSKVNCAALRQRPAIFAARHIIALAAAATVASSSFFITFVTSIFDQVKLTTTFSTTHRHYFAHASPTTRNAWHSAHQQEFISPAG